VALNKGGEQIVQVTGFKEEIIMARQADLNKVYVISQDDVVTRDIQGDFIIIPITAGIGDMENQIFSLNDTGRAVWDKLDGKRSLSAIIKELSLKYDGPVEEIGKDVVGIISELFKRKMVKAVGS
jgi:hypothetical protein